MNMEYNTQVKFLKSTDEMHKFYDKGFVFSALYGSQNYGLATPTSDVDVKCAFLPAPRDVLLMEKRMAYTHTENGSTDNTVLAKDLRDVFNEFYKQNLNFLEVLATPYFIVEPPYAEMMNELRKRSNEVAHYYERGFYLCTCGLFNKLDTDFQKGRVDKKKFTFGLYLRDFVNKYSNGTEFKDCFESENKDFYTSVRLSDSDNFVERYNCKGDYHELWYEAKADMREYFNKAQDMSQTKNDNTHKWMDELLYDCIWKYVVLEGR